MASRVTARDVDVLNSAPTLVAPADHHRRSLAISNAGPNAIYLGPADVTTATGYPVAATSGSVQLSDFFLPEGLYAIAGTADQSGTANTRVLESFDG